MKILHDLYGESQRSAYASCAFYNRMASVRLFLLWCLFLSEEVDHSEQTDSDLDLEDES